MFNNKYSQEYGGKAINIAHLIACRQVDWGGATKRNDWMSTAIYYGT